MSTLSKKDTSPLLSEQEQQKLRNKLNLNQRNSLEKLWQKEAKSLAISFRYYEPASYLAQKLGEEPRKKEVFWLLIFLFMWQEKGHSIVDLRLWPSWIKLCLQEQETIYLYKNQLDKPQEDFKLICRWVKLKILKPEHLKDLFKDNPRLISPLRENVQSPFIWDEKKKVLFFSKLLEKEKSYLQCLLKILKRSSVQNLDLSQKDTLLKALEEHIYPLKLNKEQLTFINRCFSHSFLILSGGPGTGKTSTIVNFLRVFIALWMPSYAPRIALCAPTGLASRRLKESLMHGLTQSFYYKEKEIDKLISQQEPLILQGLLGTSPWSKSPYNAENPLPFDLIVLDEASMVDTQLMHKLLEAVGSKSSLVLIGDAHQLAPVEWGSPFYDLVRLAKKQTTLLNSCCTCLSLNYRFGKQITLKKMAQLVLEKKSEDFLSLLQKSKTQQGVRFALASSPYELSQELYQQFILGLTPKNSLDEELKIFSNKKVEQATHDLNFAPALVNILKRSLILSSHNKGLWGVDKINDYLLEAHQKHIKKHLAQASYMPLWGVPIMVTRNRSDLEVFNGQRGLIFYQDDSSPLAYAYFWIKGTWHFFPLSHLGNDYSLSFCASIHKSQGGEYEHVSLILGEKRAILSQELLYTALTRAKNTVYICSTPQILRYSCELSSSRLSYLSLNSNNFVQML